METKLNIFMKILTILSGNPKKSYDLEYLTSFVIPCSHQPNLWIQRGYQAEVLDALILLDNHGLIILDPVSDQSVISIKGLISISSTTFSN